MGNRKKILCLQQERIVILNVVSNFPLLSKILPPIAVNVSFPSIVAEQTINHSLYINKAHQKKIIINTRVKVILEVQIDCIYVYPNCIDDRNSFSFLTNTNNIYLLMVSTPILFGINIFNC